MTRGGSIHARRAPVAPKDAAIDVVSTRALLTLARTKVQLPALLSRQGNRPRWRYRQAE